MPEHRSTTLSAEAIGALRDTLGCSRISTEADALDARSHDAWPVSSVLAKLGRHPYRPDVIVRATTLDEVVATIKLAATHDLPITTWGLGSSVTGQPLPLAGGICLDLSELVSEPVLHETDRIVTVAAGVRGGLLEEWLNARGFTLNHSPQSLLRSTVGGWVATRATGQFSSRYGGIENLIVAYQAVLADASVVDLKQRPRAAMGPDLRAVLMGSEGALGVITRVSLKVFALANHRLTEAFRVPSVTAGLDAIRTAYQAGLRPFLVRFYDQAEARHVLADPKFSTPLLLVGSEGPTTVAAAEHTTMVDILTDAGCISLGSAPVERWMSNRFDFSAVEALLAEPGGYAETIEVANFWSRLEPMYEGLIKALAPLADETFCHFSHIYDQGASLYVILRGRAANDEEALARLDAIWRTAMSVVILHDGELSHHHGGGIARCPYVERSLGSGFAVLKRLKQALDPGGLFNPGKLALDPKRE